MAGLELRPRGREALEAPGNPGTPVATAELARPEAAVPLMAEVEAAPGPALIPEAQAKVALQRRKPLLQRRRPTVLVPPGPPGSVSAAALVINPYGLQMVLVPFQTVSIGALRTCSW